MNVGDLVTRNSYHNDIPFLITDISDDTALLSGLYYRLFADAPLNDLSSYPICSTEVCFSASTTTTTIDHLTCTNTKGFVSSLFSTFKYSDKLHGQDETWVNECPYVQNCNVTILHIDGNRRYLKECLSQYSAYGIPVIGVSIKEEKQPACIQRLLEQYKPNILVITGHDSVKKANFTPADLDCYLNSRYFVESVKIARTYNPDPQKLVIIAGGCKSNYEALIEAGANFASSPERILINVTEPVTIACRIATTSMDRMISMDKIAEELPSGTGGFGGIKTRGQCREIRPDL